MVVPQTHDAMGHIVIFVAVLASVTVVVVSSLVFADRVMKWEAAEDEAAEVTILQYQQICLGMACPKCGDKAVNPEYSGIVTVKRGRGPRLPEACKEPAKCPARHRSHLHVTCWSCESKWMMATADTKAAETAA